MNANPASANAPQGEMFDDLWDIIEPFAWFIHAVHTLEVYVPLRSYRTVREALERHIHKYPGESYVLLLDQL